MASAARDDDGTALPCPSQIRRRGASREFRRGAGGTLVATQRLEPGHLVLRNRPYAFALHREWDGVRCSHCFARMERPMCCSGCRTQWYCGRACQRAAWGAYHKAECAGLVRLGRYGLEREAWQDAVLVARVLRTAGAVGRAPPDGGADADGEASSWDDVWSMVGHEADGAEPGDEAQARGRARIADALDECGLLPNDLHDALAQAPGGGAGGVCCGESEIGRYLEAPPLPAGADAAAPSTGAGRVRPLVAPLLSRFQCNNFAVVDDLFNALGAGVFPMGALLNHSCWPNCVVVYAPGGHVQEVRCVRAVEPGEELTHAYLDVALPTAERRGRLRAAYHFACRCERCMACSSSPPPPPALAADLPALHRRWLLQDAHVVARSGGSDAATAASELRRAEELSAAADAEGDARAELRLRVLALGLRKRHLHPHHLQVVAATSALLTAALVAGEPRMATAMCAELVAAYEALYFEHHPLLALQRYTLGDLLRGAAGERARAAGVLRAALASLRVIMGEERAFVRDLAALCEQVEQGE